MGAHNMFNTKLCQILGLDVEKVASFTIVGTGEETTVTVEWMPDLNAEELHNWTETYTIVGQADGLPPHQ